MAVWRVAKRPQSQEAAALLAAVTARYRHPNMQYRKGRYLRNVGLESEPYFRCFDYADFLTPHSGLIQIRKYSEQEALDDVLAHFAAVSEAAKAVRARLHELLIGEIAYFGQENCIFAA